MAGCADVLGRVEVFERDWNAMKRAFIFTGAYLLFSLLSLFECQIGGDCDEAVQFAIDGLDSFQAGLSELRRGKVFAPKSVRSFCYAEMR
jgi:hypothetical protein